jgi:Bacterial surface proteins containing Ig-like domains
MKRLRVKTIAVLIALSLLTPIVVFNTNNTISVNAATIKLNATELTLTVGKSTLLKITGTKKKVVWVSDKKTVATVTNGKVTAKKVGVTTITAKVDGKKYTCRVRIEDKRYEKVLDEYRNNDTYKSYKEEYGWDVEYCFLDFDYDGMDELMISCPNGSEFSLWDIQDAKAVKVWTEQWTYSFLTVFTDRTFMCANTAHQEKHFNFYKEESNGIKCLQKLGNSVVSDDRTDYWNGDYNKISKEEYEQYMKTYCSDKQELKVKWLKLK